MPEIPRPKKASKTTEPAKKEKPKRAKKPTAKKDSPAKPPGAGSFVFNVIFVLIVAALLTLTGVYGEVERQVSDLSIYLAREPADRDQVVIVSIKDDDYEKLFGSRSPLDPARLNCVIRAILKFEPRVIGVDIDTTDVSFAGLDPANGDIPIVWGADAIEDQPGHLVEIVAPLGGRELPAQNFAAPFLMLPDSDDKTRHYQRELEINGTGVPHFAWKIFSLYDPAAAGSREASSDLRFIDFIDGVRENVMPHRINMPASTVLELAANNGAGDAFKDKVVLLGGYYHQNKAERGSDLHMTPLGEVFGVDLLASVVETEISGGGTKPVGRVGRIFFNFVGFVVISFLFFRFPFYKALIGSVIGIVVVSLFTMFFYSNFLIFPALLFLLLLALVDWIRDHFRTVLGAGYDSLPKRWFSSKRGRRKN